MPAARQYSTGRISASYGAQVQNPSRGPAFRQAAQAVRSKLPQQPFPKGRCCSSPAPAASQPPAPPAGPVFRQRATPARYALPSWQPRAGRVASDPGGPVLNPRRGPPVRAPLGPARARLPQLAPKAGRVVSGPGTPARDPSAGPAFRQAASPRRAALPLPLRGRVASNPGTPIPVPHPQQTPPARAVRARPAGMPGLVYSFAGSAQLPGPVLVQSAPGNATATSVTVILPGPTTAGNCLIVLVGSAATGTNGTISGVTLGGSADNFAALASFGTGSDHAVVAAWADPGCAGGQTSVVVSAAGSTGTEHLFAWAFEFSGLAPAGLLDQSATLSSSGFVTSWTLGPTGTASQASGVWFGIVCGTSSGAPALTGPASPWVNEAEQSGGTKAALAGYQIVSTAGTASYDGTASPSNTIDGLVLTVRAAVTVPAALSFATGRIAFSYGAPVQNPGTGPAFRPFTQPVQARRPLPRPGRAGSNPGAPVQNLPPVPGSVSYPRRDPARVRPSLPPRGRVASSPGAPPRNPQRGAAFPPPAQAVRAKVPQGTWPWGRAATMVAIPVPVSPVTQGPPFRQAASPAKARLPVPFLKGRCSGNPGAPVQNPSVQPPPPLPGQPAGLRVIFLRTGSAQATSSPARPAPPATRGPVFRQAGQPARIRPSLPTRGHASSNPGAPVQNPPPPIAGPPFFPLRQAVHIRFAQPPRGRTAGSQGARVRNPQQGAAFPARHGPAQTGQPLPPRGRTTSGPGAPPRNPPAAGPAIPQAGQPVRARLPLPARGRVASDPGGPVLNPVTHAGPPFFPPHWPARTRITLPPHGRTAGGQGAPARNPARGPRFAQATQPCRARIPQNAPRGRTASNPGGPVANIPVNRILISAGDLFVLWETGTLAVLWETGTLFTSQ